MPKKKTAGIGSTIEVAVTALGLGLLVIPAVTHPGAAAGQSGALINDTEQMRDVVQAVGAVLATVGPLLEVSRALIKWRRTRSDAGRK
ncbi:hypothetical protein [Paraburkholderia tropica]|uniref:hypothetical protein n=1 Tax=Paraburkholderia tropica TaxID=92647 RepID=UPI001CC64C8B|nr:hypothetical protein [Paraburkholderia tropica]